MDRLDASIKSYPHAEGIEAIMTQTDMTPLQRLAKVLQLGTPSNYRNHTYINGESLYFPTGRVYGGQVIAQSLMAASRTVRICCSTWKICVTDVPSPPVA